MTYRALIFNKNDAGEISGSVQSISDSDLPQGGDVLVAVDYSSLNYKDGLCMTGIGNLVRDFPHIPGIDMAGTVLESGDDRYSPGDKVILTGWRYGEIWWGGYAERTRVKADWLVPLPEQLTTRQAMAVGTAGLTAILAIMALEDHGLTPEKGEVLVTGAAGGVGSVAVAALARRGYQVAAVTGRQEMAEYLTELGASRIIPRDDIAAPTNRPMESATWAGCIESVGGTTLSRVLGQMQYGASVAAFGNASGIKLETTVLPFILRGVNLLGIDSVMQPYENRIKAWQNTTDWLPIDKLESMTVEAKLEDMVDYAQAILKGQVKGRVVVSPHA